MGPGVWGVAPRKRSFYGAFGAFVRPIRKPLWNKGLRREKSTIFRSPENSGAFGAFDRPIVVSACCQTTYEKFDDFSRFSEFEAKIGPILG